MIWLDTKEEVDFDWFMEVLENNELQVVSREWTQEEEEELSREIARRKAIKQKNKAKELVYA